MDKNPPVNAGDMGSIPGWGTKIPHAEEQLSLGPAVTEPTCSRTCKPQLEGPCAATKDPAGHNGDLAVATKIQHSQINEYLILKKIFNSYT